MESKLPHFARSQAPSSRKSSFSPSGVLNPPAVLPSPAVPALPRDSQSGAVLAKQVSLAPALAASAAPATPETPPRVKKRARRDPLATSPPSTSTAQARETTRALFPYASSQTFVHSGNICALIVKSCTRADVTLLRPLCTSGMIGTSSAAMASTSHMSSRRLSLSIV